jgi:hypothetical protein
MANCRVLRVLVLCNTFLLLSTSGMALTPAAIVANLRAAPVPSGRSRQTCRSQTNASTCTRSACGIGMCSARVCMQAAVRGICPPIHAIPREPLRDLLTFKDGLRFRALPQQLIFQAVGYVSTVLEDRLHATRIATAATSKRSTCFDWDRTCLS